MNTLYTWNTPNGQKPAILLEELQVAYELVPVDITRGAQFEADFVRVNPNSKIPAYADNHVTVFESGAILEYLADQHGTFLAKAGQARATALAWCHWQVGGLGPSIGQWAHFAAKAESTEPGGLSSYAADRFLNEALRLLKVLDNRLADASYVAGDAYSIADIMSYPWVLGGLDRLKPAAGAALPELTHIERWLTAISARPAV